MLDIRLLFAYDALFGTPGRSALPSAPSLPTGSRRDLGFVGRPRKVNPRILELAWKKGMVPVVASLAPGPRGEYFNINADDFAAALGWPAIDLVKMDIEGAEPLALSGMQRLLDRSPQLRLIVEFSPGMIEAGGVAPEGFLAILARCGLELFVIEDDASLVPLSPGQFPAWTGKVRERGVVNLLCQKPRPAKTRRASGARTKARGRRECL